MLIRAELQLDPNAHNIIFFYSDFKVSRCMEDLKISVLVIVDIFENKQTTNPILFFIRRPNGLFLEEEEDDRILWSVTIIQVKCLVLLWPNHWLFV